MKKALMVSYGGGHANILRTLYPVLKESGRWNVTVLALTTAPLIYRRYGIPFMTISEFASVLPEYPEICEIGKERGLPYHNPAFNLPEADTIAYYGIGYHDLVKQYGEEAALRKFQEEGRKAFLPVETMERLLAYYAPDVALVTASPRFERAAGIAANRLRIPTLRVNDLPIMTSCDFNAEVCVMNEWAKRYAESRFPALKGHIHVTGQPVFELESNAQRNFSSVCAFRDKTLGRNYARMVVYFTRGGGDETPELQALDELAGEYQDALFIIKIHPNQTLESVYAPRSSNAVVSAGEAAAYVCACDLAITAFSTTGLEAALLDKPLIEINFHGESYEMDYSDMGIACLARNAGELKRLIGRLLDENSAESRELKQSRRMFQNEKRASENIRDVMDACAHTGTRS